MCPMCGGQMIEEVPVGDHKTRYFFCLDCEYSEDVEPYDGPSGPFIGDPGELPDVP